jgi:hypothetical protein
MHPVALELIQPRGVYLLTHFGTFVIGLECFLDFFAIIHAELDRFELDTEVRSRW